MLADIESRSGILKVLINNLRKEMKLGEEHPLYLEDGLREEMPEIQGRHFQIGKLTS